MKSQTKLICVCCLLAAPLHAALADPIQTLPDLAEVRIYEETFTTSTISYAPNSTALTTRLAGSLNVRNRDFGFVPEESYDVFYSDAGGAPHPLGGYLTIEGVWQVPGLREGSMNINEVELVFGGINPRTQFGDFVASFVVGSICDPNFGDNCIPGSEARAVDHNLSTFPRFGQTSTTNLNERFRLTIGFRGISDIPEPSTVLLAAVAGLGLLRRRKQTSPQRGARQ